MDFLFRADETLIPRVAINESIPLQKKVTGAYLSILSLS